MLDLQNNIKSSQVCGPQTCELCFFPPGINRKSPARRPGGFEIRRKKRFDLLKPGDLQSPNNTPQKHKLDVADCKSAERLTGKDRVLWQQRDE